MRFWSLLLAGLASATPFPQLPPRDTASSSAQRAAAIKEAYLHSWTGYSTYAFGHDELNPLSNSSSDSRNGWGASIADALTTGILMELPDVVEQQINQLAKVDFSVPHTADTVSLFETTIRYLGGLISGYELLTGPYANLLPKSSAATVKKLLDQAQVLANGLSFAFETPSGVPWNNLNYTTRTSADPTNGIATIGTLVLEWTRLADLTGNKTYAEISQKGEAYLINPKPALGEPYPGLLGTDVNITTGQFIDAGGSWSGGDDSFYEYLIKAWVYDPQRFGKYKDRWVTAVESTMKIMLQHPSSRHDVTFVNQWNNSTSLQHVQGHLTCFIGGNFLLGGELLGRPDIFNAGLALTSGCHDTYVSTVTGIGPEQFSWDTSGIPANQKNFYNKNGFYITTPYYDLRPEVVESYYYAYRLTGNKIYQEWAWDAFQAINAACRTPSGYAWISDVNAPNGGTQQDFQESFWFAEVLKYFYLIFDEDSKVGVQKGGQQWVFNTEAHPFKVSSGKYS